MNLLIDLGNSRLKWAWADNKNLSPGPAIPNHSLGIAQLTAAWHTPDQPKRVGVACVGNPRNLTLVKQAVSSLWPGRPVIEYQSKDHDFGVTNAYQQPENLGVDRWLALIAAHQLYRENACIVDCGTAITVDLLAKNGMHRGGHICPGLRMMKQALFKHTQNLPLGDEAFPLTAATSTAAAIYAGTLNAALGLIAQVMAQQPPATRLILTGGDAELLAGHMQPKPLINADLVLYGLAIVMADKSSDDQNFRF